MEEAYAWAQDQRELHREAFSTFLNQQRQKWTPSSVFHSCCVKFLADGSYQEPFGYDYDDAEDFGGYSRRGCRGQAHCGRAHPIITLWYTDTRRRNTDETIAKISHDLDPFLKYFQDRVKDGSARPLQSEKGQTCFALNGFLRENLTKLHQTDLFGAHLVKVGSQDELKSSDQAQKQVLEDGMKRPAKKQKTSQFIPVHFDLVDSAFEIFMTAQWDCHALDLVDLYHFRLSNLTLGRVAARMIQKRMTGLELSLGLYKNGHRVYGMDHYSMMDDDEQMEPEIMDPYNPEDCSSLKYIPLPIASLKPLNEETFTVFVANQVQPLSIDWDSGFLVEKEYEPRASADWSYSTSEESAFDYEGQKLVVYARLVDPLSRLTATTSISGAASAPTSRQSELVTRRPAGAVLARFKVTPKISVGSKTVGHTQLVSIQYEVDQATVSEGVVNPWGLDTDNQESSDNDEEGKTYSRFQGSLHIDHVQITFLALAREFAKEKLQKLKAEQRKIEARRPLLDREINYAKAVEDIATFTPPSP